MKHKELTKTFIIEENPLVSMAYTHIFVDVSVKGYLSTSQGPYSRTSYDIS